MDTFYYFVLSTLQLQFEIDMKHQTKQTVKLVIYTFCLLFHAAEPYLEPYILRPILLLEEVI